MKTRVSLAEACIEFDGQRLLLQNSRVRRVIDLQQDLFATRSLICLETGCEWVADQQRSAISLNGDEGFAASFHLEDVRLEAVESPLWEQPHLCATVQAVCSSGRLTRYYQIYSGSPVTVCWTKLQGHFPGKHDPPGLDVRGRRLMPDGVPFDGEAPDRHDTLYLAERHLRIRNTRFVDCTDINDNLVLEEQRYSWPSPLPWRLEGNLLFAESLVSGNGLFMLKEAPVLADQPDHPDADFLYSMDSGMLAQAGWGMRPEDVTEPKQYASWRTVVGVYPPGQWQDSIAVKTYLRSRCRMQPRRDWLIACNQWGDRRKGAQLSEEWVRREIDACAGMGFEAYLIDAGWQTGDLDDVYSAFGRGENPFYGDRPFWDVDKQKFPHGLEPVAGYARNRGIDLVMWFNTDFTSANANWQKDAAALVGIQRKTDAVGLKIDDVWNLTPEANRRSMQMLERVYTECGGQAAFHLDITAGARWGYFLAHHLGLLYTVNRYTHWHNYFPYRIQRNLWQLSRYLLPQRLQFVFLNNSPQRAAAYQPAYSADDPFTPGNYGLGYLFASVMFSNPLAFLEATALTAEQQETLRGVIGAYRPVRDEMFRGDIFPLGEEPSGRALTAFQSQDLTSGNGFVCVYRDATERDTLETELVGVERAPSLQLLYGEGHAEAGASSVRFRLPRQRSFALFRIRSS